MGYGICLHLAETEFPEERKAFQAARIAHFSSALPRVDHMAFLSSDLRVVREVLDRANVFYKADNPAPGINQIFLFDPDGNVLEISNCAPNIGATTCSVAEEEKRSAVRSLFGRASAERGSSTGHYVEE